MTILASATGVLLPDFYLDPAPVIPAMRGQDLVTLVASPLLGAAMWAHQRGSVRAALIWIGLLGYLVYIFTGAAFAYHFNRLFLVYIAGFALSIAALITAVAGVDIGHLRKAFDASTPRRSVAAFLGFIALVLVASELGQVIQALSTGTIPALIVRSEGAGNFVYVLDLGLVLPLSLLGGWWLLRSRPWGYLVAGSMLIKALTMGLALLVSTWFSVRNGYPLESGLTLGYGLIAGGALVLSIWYFRHCHP